MQLVSSISAAFFTSGNKVLAKDSSIAIDDNKGERRGFLGI
jgi:hypothetical protein